MFVKVVYYVIWEMLNNIVPYSLSEKKTVRVLEFESGPRGLWDPRYKSQWNQIYLGHIKETTGSILMIWSHMKAFGS